MRKGLLSSLLWICAHNLTAQIPTQYLAEEARLDARRLRGISSLPIEQLLALHGDTMIVMAKDAYVPMMFDMKAAVNSWNHNMWSSLKPGRYGVGGVGLIGDKIWAEDRNAREITLLDHSATLVKSVPLPSWIHPHWADRHKYPLIGEMVVAGFYDNGKMIVRAGKPRTLFDTPGYKRSLTHLLLIEPGGAVEKEIAQFDYWSHRVILYTQANTGDFTILAPWAMGDRWHVSSDGSRIVVAHAGVLASDSGKVRVTSINERGDTVFSKWYAVGSVPVTKTDVDSALKKYNNYGSLTAAQVQDSVRKRIPAWKSLLASVLNSGNSTWLFTRSAADSVKDQTAWLLDDHGTVVQKMLVPASLTPLAVDRSHLWAYDRDQKNQGVVRFALQATPAATPAPQSRSGSNVAGKRPGSR